MTYYDPFVCKINCEEFFSSPVDEAEVDEVMRLMVQEADGLQGFSEWLDSLEETERQAVFEQQVDCKVVCYFCKLTITPAQETEHHHPVYKSQGGTETAPAHKICHRNFHSSNGDFKAWCRIGGQLTALTRRWAFNLSHVKDNPAYELDRQFYRAFYAK